MISRVSAAQQASAKMGKPN